MAIATRRLTLEEFMKEDWPPTVQLIHGEVVQVNASFDHNRIRQSIFLALHQWTRAEPERGEAGLGGNWVLSPDSLVIPDVWWASEEDRPSGLFVNGAPDLAVEVRSPGTWRYDIGAKRDLYLEAGVQELWLVDTDARAVIGYRRRRGAAILPSFDEGFEATAGDQLTSPLLPGFALEIAEILPG
jgi:Uma2 family endonuclease